MVEELDRWADPPLLVLASLADEPRHGYAIIQDVAQTMGVQLSAGTLYAVISRLEARGLIEPLAPRPGAAPTGSPRPGRRNWRSRPSACARWRTWRTQG